jgi:hypothetical protein
MRKVTGILWLSLLLVAVTPVGARPQFGRNDNRSSGDRVCVYQNNNFQGWEECYRPGDEVADLNTRSNNISSIRVFGRAIITVYDGRNFQGASAQISSEVNDLMRLNAGGFANRQNWNDRIESFRVTSPNYRAEEPPTVFGRNDGRNDRRDDRRDSRRDDRRDDRRDNRSGNREPDSICLYEDTNFRGRVECFDAGSRVSDLGRSGNWSDKVSSIRIIGEGRAAAYLDIGYRGEHLVIDQDIPNLSHLRLSNGRTWDNQISSLEVVGGGRRAVGRR